MAIKRTPTERMSIENVVREHRRKVGITQDELPRRCGVSRQTIVTVEGHSHVPTLALALRLARELGSSVDELFRIEE